MGKEHNPVLPAAPARRRRAADYLGLERNVVIVSAVVFLLGFGEELWKRYLPKYLEAHGAAEEHIPSGLLNYAANNTA